MTLHHPDTTLQQHHPIPPLTHHLVSSPARGAHIGRQTHTHTHTHGHAHAQKHTHTYTGVFRVNPTGRGDKKRIEERRREER